MFLTHLIDMAIRVRCHAVNSRGSIMVETVVAVIAFSLVGSAVLVGLSTAHSSASRTDRQSIGENVGRNQMEYIFSLPYQSPPHTYPSVSAPPGYMVTAAAEEFVMGDPNIEKLNVTVSRDGGNILVLETLRARD